MRTSSALAAAALLVAVSAPATSSAPPSTVHLASQTVTPDIRLKGQRIHLPTIQAMFQGSFINSNGQHYDVMGQGKFLPVAIGNQSGYRYTVTMAAFPRSSSYPKIDFGVMDGQGPVDSSNPPGQLTFQILGTPSVTGYRLDVTGQIMEGFMNGTFGISGDDGSGQGDMGGT
jgi:hypothetical protein